MGKDHLQVVFMGYRGGTEAVQRQYRGSVEAV